MCSGERRPGNAEKGRPLGGALSYFCFLQEPPGRPLEGIDVFDVDHATPDLQCSLVLKAPEGPRHGLPVGAYHGAEVLVGVAGRYAYLPRDLNPFALL